MHDAWRASETESFRKQTEKKVASRGAGEEEVLGKETNKKISHPNLLSYWKRNF